MSKRKKSGKYTEKKGFMYDMENIETMFSQVRLTL